VLKGKMAYKKKAKKIKRNVHEAIAHVQSSFNNTLVTITTVEGDVLLRGSSGQQGFKGARKSTPFAATQVTNDLAKKMLDLGIKQVQVQLQGPGSARESVVRAMQASGVDVIVLKDVTPLPHNGPRAPKKRRV
jgi:small subunit ribosomal protein S11